MKTLLVPVDFSDCSLAALSMASEIARRTQAELVLLHADEFPIMPVGEPAFLPVHVVKEHRRWVDEQLEHIAERARQGGLTVRSCAIVGPAHQVIVDAATAEGADLIIMGTHGRRGFHRLFAGTVTERVVRMSKVPVLAVRDAGPQANAA
jgi:nucleotide-binding universal stress UspA family protein